MSRSQGIRSRRRGESEKAENSANVLTRKSINRDSGIEETYTRTDAILGLNDLIDPSSDITAKITVSIDLSDKTYGNGASAMCSVTLHATQTEHTIQRAFELARTICEEEGAAALVGAKRTYAAATEQRS